MSALAFPALLTAIADRSAAFRAAAAAAGDGRPVPGCPDWSVLDLRTHLGEVQRFWAAAVMAGPAAGPPDEDRSAGRQQPADPADLLGGSTGALISALRDAGPDRGCWTWWEDSGAPMTAAAVARHQAQEAAVHAFDAQEAAGSSEPLPAAIAADSIAEFLAVSVPMSLPWPYPPATLAITAADAGSWLVQLSTSRSRAQPAAAEQRDQPPDASAAGTASDVVLALYGRRPAGILDVTGNADILGQFLAWLDRG